MYWLVHGMYATSVVSDCHSFFDSYQCLYLLVFVQIYVLHETATQCIATTQTAMGTCILTRHHKLQCRAFDHAVFQGIAALCVGECARFKSYERWEGW